MSRCVCVSVYIHLGFLNRQQKEREIPVSCWGEVSTIGCVAATTGEKPSCPPAAQDTGSPVG